MADVLSQSQIDALLNSMQGGGNAPPTKEDAQEKKYRKYDFTSPRKFTKDRLKMLSSIFESYSRIINTRINGLLRTSCEVEVSSVEEQRYYEFANALTEGSVLTVAYLNMTDVTEEAPVLFYASPQVILNMIDRMLGGTGDQDGTLSDDYVYTDLEIRLYENLMREFVSVLGSSWENYIPLSFDFGRVENNPTLVQLIGVDETVVLVDLSIKFPNCSGYISVCFPGMMLTNIFAKISQGTPSRRIEAEDRSEQIFDNLRDSNLEVVAELGRTTLKLSDIYNLNVGDVIDLSQKKDSSVHLYIGNRKWFDGMMGVSDNHIAVKIKDVYQKAERKGSQVNEQ